MNRFTSVKKQWIDFTYRSSMRYCNDFRLDWLVGFPYGKKDLQSLPVSLIQSINSGVNSCRSASVPVTVMEEQLWLGGPLHWPNVISFFYMLSNFCRVFLPEQASFDPWLGSICSYFEPQIKLMATLRVSTIYFALE